jgi:hypothetical protein
MNVDLVLNAGVRADNLKIVNNDVAAVKRGKNHGGEAFIAGAALSCKNRMVVVVQIVVTGTSVHSRRPDAPRKFRMLYNALYAVPISVIPAVSRSARVDCH